MAYEDDLAKAGDFGLYQKLLCCILVAYTTLLCAVNYHTQLFIFSTPDHRCQEYEIDLLQGQFEANWDFVRPWIPVEQGYASKCKVISIQNDTEDAFLQISTTFFRHFNATSSDEFNIIRDNVLKFVDSVEHKQCDDGYVYNHNTIFNTITSDHDWVCDDDWKPIFIQTIFWVGNTFGCCLWGFTNDRWGRKPTILITHIIYCLAGFFTLFAPNFSWLLICRFLVGSSHHTVSHLPYLLVVEYCGVTSRIFPLLTVIVSYSLMSMSLPWLALALPSWRVLVITSSILVLPVIILGYKFIPESPSWLLVKGQTEKAKVILRSVAEINKKIKALDDDLTLFSEIENEENEQNKDPEASLFKLFKTPNLRKNALLVNIICMMGFMCYYGHVQNTSNIGDDHYMNFFLAALVEIPSWFTPLFINKLGRRWPLLALFGTSGLCGVAYGFIPRELLAVSMAVALVGRCMISSAYFICLQYASEIFPTVVRGQGVAMCEFVGGIAILVSPSIIYLAKVEPVLPLMILGVCSFIGAVATFFLPETAQKTLPQTLEDGKNFGIDQFGYYSICCDKTNRNNVKNNSKDDIHLPEDEPVLMRFDRRQSCAIFIDRRDSYAILITVL